ncbi:MAG: hypothetical protein KDC90_04640 [Ignavibacteriae bacterium]|nr:hypothetical protein [Ignavibacteriota bacterium]
MKNLILKILLLILISFATNLAQNAEADTSLAINESDTVFVMQKSPMGAMLRSAVLPGWGQFYNESYWKIPIVWGISAWFAYNWIEQNDSYKYYQDLYNISLTETSNGNSDYKSLRDFYRDDRDLFGIYLGLTYFLNLIDAYVDAHLFDFDVGMNEFTQKPELRIRMNL